MRGHSSFRTALCLFLFVVLAVSATGSAALRIIQSFYYRKNLGRVLSCDVTRGTQHENTPGRGGSALITEFQAEYLLADRGFDTDSINRCSLQAGMMPVIPPKKNRKVLRNYDKHIYKLRHLVENAFLRLKKWRGITTR